MSQVRLRLYRAGWTGDKLPWDDAQLWASSQQEIPPKIDLAFQLEPQYGSAADWYVVHLYYQEEIEPGWVSYQALLTYNNTAIGGGRLPLSWYVGTPTDWQSGLARFPESYGPRTNLQPYGEDGPRGVWVLTAGRAN